MKNVSVSVSVSVVDFLVRAGLRPPDGDVNALTAGDTAVVVDGVAA